MPHRLYCLCFELISIFPTACLVLEVSGGFLCRYLAARNCKVCQAIQVCVLQLINTNVIFFIKLLFSYFVVLLAVQQSLVSPGEVRWGQACGHLLCD